MLIIGCHYHRANMVIKNETNRQICYSTLAKNADNKYYEIAAGGKINSHNQDSPIVRGCSDSFKIDINSYSDKLIYIAFYNTEEQQYVFKNIDSMLNTGKLKLMKYSKKELDNMNWVITYSEK
ncbi:hypothetical protein AB674_07475 [Flavobacterium sp. ABG]|nr:hypothetical protein AB674_07475 [Flavobacterium sp. ABG]